MDESVFTFEFKNGIYISNDRGGILTDKTKYFIERDSPEFEAINVNKITQKHLDIVFDNSEYSNWYNIETPFLDSIFEHQQFSEEVKRWIYIMLGRLFYPMGLHDDWGLVVFLHGVSNSGKSSILKVMSNIIGDPHVDTFMAEEKTKMLALDEASDEPMNRSTLVDSIRSTIPWKSSMIMTSRKNLFLAGEHATTHMFPVKFNYMYKGKCVDLEDGLFNERGKILRKTNEAYLESILDYGELEDVKTILPDYFLS